MKRKSKCLSLTLCSHFHVSLKEISLLMGLLSLFRWCCGGLDYKSCTTWQEKSVGSTKPAESENDPHDPNVDPVSTDFWYWWYLEIRSWFKVVWFACLLTVYVPLGLPDSFQVYSLCENFWKYSVCSRDDFKQVSNIGAHLGSWKLHSLGSVWCIAYEFFHFSCSWITHL